MAHVYKRMNAKFLLEVTENTDVFFPIPIPPEVHSHGLLGGMQSPSEALALDQGTAGYGRNAKSSLLPVLINKVLLSHSHTHSFTYSLVLLLCYNGTVEYFVIDIYYLALHRNILLSPVLDRPSELEFSKLLGAAGAQV